VGGGAAVTGGVVGGGCVGSAAVGPAVDGGTVVVVVGLTVAVVGAGVVGSGGPNRWPPGSTVAIGSSRCVTGADVLGMVGTENVRCERSAFPEDGEAEPRVMIGITTTAETMRKQAAVSTRRPVRECTLAITMLMSSSTLKRSRRRTSSLLGFSARPFSFIDQWPKIALSF
jgi:hypothetical protein